MPRPLGIKDRTIPYEYPHTHVRPPPFLSLQPLSNAGSYFQEGKADIEAGECQNENQTVHVLELGAIRCEERDKLSENIRIPLYFARLL